MEAIGDFQTLRKAVRNAEKGTGSVREAIQSANFFITGRNFTGLIRSFRNSREWEKALEVFETVRICDPTLGEPPSFYTFSAIISVCSKSGQLEQALRLLREMKACATGDPSLMPDAAVYRLIIRCCIKLERCNEAVDLLEEMWQQGIEADQDTMEKTIWGLVQEKSWRHAMKVLNRLHGCDIALTVEQYGDLIESAVKAGCTGVATEVFLTMQMVGLDPDDRCCYNLLLATACNENLENTIQLLEGMNECQIPISTKIYAHVLRECLAAGCFEAGLRVVELMERDSN